MAGRLFFVFLVLIAEQSHAARRCGYEEMLETPQPIAGLARPSKNLGEAPYPLKELPGAFSSAHFDGMRATLGKLGLDLEPGREYLADKNNAVHAYDQWKIDFDTAMKDPELKRQAEMFLLSYLQNPPRTAAGDDSYHPGLDEKSALPRHRTLEDFYSDNDCYRPLDTIANTFENYLEFRSVLGNDTYQDPARRSKTITQMRAAYMISSLMRGRRPKTTKYYDLGQ